MTKETKKNLFEAAVGCAAVLLVVSGGILVTASVGRTYDSQVAAQEPQPKSAVTVPHNLKPEKIKEDEFEKELKKNLKENHSSTMTALEEQAKVLDRIESLLKEDSLEADTVKAVRKSPIRMRSTTWNLMGTWNYTTEMLRSHLKNEHKIDVEGYDRKELQIMHDNIHNGFDPMGSELNSSQGSSAAQPTTVKPVVRTRKSGGLFRTLFPRSSSNCFGGT